MQKATATWSKSPPNHHASKLKTMQHACLTSWDSKGYRAFHFYRGVSDLCTEGNRRCHLRCGKTPSFRIYIKMLHGQTFLRTRCEISDTAFEDSPSAGLTAIWNRKKKKKVWVKPKTTSSCRVHGQIII